MHMYVVSFVTMRLNNFVLENEFSHKTISYSVWLEKFVMEKIVFTSHPFYVYTDIEQNISDISI